MMKCKFKILLIAAIVLSLACTTKVSEWFLLNAAPDNYLLVYYHKDPIPESIEKNHVELEQENISANVIFKPILKASIDKPYYALYYKNRLFSTYHDFKSVEKLFVSPVRNKIAEELLAGKLCALVFLKSGNDAKDNEYLQVVNNTIAASPFSKIVKVIEIDRESGQEQDFISMLLNVEHDLKDINEPMLFGVFGRFRVLEPLLAKGISKENINLLLGFLTADCSCLIKDNLPGINILCRNQWLDPKQALVNNILDTPQ